MVKIIQGFRRPSPIAEGVRNAAESLFGDRLTPALKQAQLDQTRQDMALTEREANTSRAFAEDLGDPLLGNAALGGFKGQDVADFNRLRAAREAAESGGDLLGNIDLNAAMMGAGQSADDTGPGMREGHKSDFRRTKYSSDASAGARIRSAEISAAQRAAANRARLAAEAEQASNELVSVVDQRGNTRLVPRGNVNFMHQPAPEDLDQAQAFEFERLRRGEGLENASLFRREAVGAAPDSSQVEGELLLQNFENLGGLGPRQAESLGALPTPPSETQVRADVLGQALEATGFDPSTVPEDVLMSAAGFEEPEAGVFETADGRQFWSTDNGLHDMETGERMPPSVEIGPVNATSREDAGLSPTTKTASDQFDRVSSLRSLDDLLGAMRTTVENNPQAIGLEGSVRSAAMGASNVMRSVDGLLGGEGAVSSQFRAAQQASLDSAVADESGQQALSELGFYDPSIDEVTQLYTLILFQGAAALAGQQGRALSDKDLKIIKNALPDPRSMFMSQERYLGALNNVENIVGLEQTATEERLQGDFNAEAPAETDAPEGLPPEVSEVWQFMTPEERALWLN